MNPGIKPLQQERQSETYHRKQVLLKIEDKIILICFWSIHVKTVLILADGQWCIVNPWLICYQFPYCEILLLVYCHIKLWVSCLSFFVVCVSAWCLVWNPVTQMPSSHLAFTLSHSTAADILLWRGRCDGPTECEVDCGCCLWNSSQYFWGVALIFLPLVFLILCADFVYIFVNAKYAYLTLFHCLLYLLDICLYFL